ncbi:DUF1488 domain-containing protein [Chelativorans sp. M5D2P16]|uniref:DUF1488 domain-containing protein n=1 Tax=Chelativorans sp. M5D2P16 TaxID=3095678 RepID=UPI002ACA7D56|nr:DUF1488 domain-containing protein [Chelativorans sp. M5D2P16]MDZ5697495.1 DUF1488 domain-containing protein [Chelativorans sp. M5D2P16]
MTLTFPNRSRSYDETRERVRFIGHDGMFEVRFSVETNALSTATDDEAHYLAAFDAARTTIHDVAREIYRNARKTEYVLTAADFR